MPRIDGILESSLYVADLPRSRAFYRDLFGFELLMDEPRMCALDVAGRQVLLLFLEGASEEPNPVPGGVVPRHGAGGRIHLAFSIPTDELEAWKRQLAANGIALESTVHAPRGGTSIYFRDPDGHLIELATPGLWRW
ncbi:MAG TPA: VOC family protein [Tepidisphaeraceae bacterium]|nr:VOC family protein [Tepidisphaeraceae bacterium]